MTSTDDRFRGFQQLVGDDAYARIARSSVCIIGLGGVGSWVAEGLARSAVGAITVVDLDDVCITNINRQLQALSSNVGRSKAEVLASRIAEINPGCLVRAEKRFFTAATADAVLLPSYDLVIDTIDAVDHKTDLLLECVRRDLPVISVGSGGDRLDPQAITVKDFAFTDYDGMLQIVRKRLRHKFNFPRGDRGRFDIPCVYAPRQRGPRIQSCAGNDPRIQPRSRKSCNDGLGSAAFMTGALGLFAAAEAIRILGAERRSLVYPWKEKRWKNEAAIGAA